MPVGPLLCVISGRTCGRAWPPPAARADLKRRAARAGVRRRFVPHQLRHAHAVELAHEGVPLIQRQLGHRNLGVTSIYLQGIDPNEIIDTVHGRRQPMIPPAPASSYRSAAENRAIAAQPVNRRPLLDPSNMGTSRAHQTGRRWAQPRTGSRSPLPLPICDSNGGWAPTVRRASGPPRAGFLVTR
jgi:integrase/recombinase XerD